MTPEQFTYWLQGFFEISDTDSLTNKQVQIIRDHLNLVFNKVTPDRGKGEIIKGPNLEKQNMCPACGNILGEGYYCRCVFTKPSVEPFSSNKCHVCGESHGSLSCPKLLVTC